MLDGRVVATLVIAAAVGCRTRPYDEPAAPIDLAAPDLAAPDLSTIDLAGVDLARSATGCADGTREGFLDESRWPRIAACAGAFLVPGVLSATLAPACGRRAGNDGPLPDGAGCDAEDLCAPGFHLCRTAAEVADRSPSGCTGAAPAPGQFFITRQSSTGCGVCATGSLLADPPCDDQSCTPGCAQTDATSNDVFGCGSTGDAPTAACAPLDRFGNNLCVALPPGWSCGVDGYTEARAVINRSPTTGGGLCCAD